MEDKKEINSGVNEFNVGTTELGNNSSNRLYTIPDIIPVNERISSSKEMNSISSTGEFHHEIKTKECYENEKGGGVQFNLNMDDKDIPSTCPSLHNKVDAKKIVCGRESGMIPIEMSSQGNPYTLFEKECLNQQRDDFEKKNTICDAGTIDLCHEIKVENYSKANGKDQQYKLPFSTSTRTIEQLRDLKCKKSATHTGDLNVQNVAAKIYKCGKCRFSSTRSYKVSSHVRLVHYERHVRLCVRHYEE